MTNTVISDFSYVRPAAGGAMNYTASMLATTPAGQYQRVAIVPKAVIGEVGDAVSPAVRVRVIPDPYKGRLSFIKIAMSQPGSTVVHWTGNWSVPGGRAKTVLTIHDFMSQHYSDMGFALSLGRRLQGWLVRRSLRRADVVIVHDEMHRARVLEMFPEAHVVVASIGPGAWVCEESTPAAVGTDLPHVLLLGGDLQHKRYAAFVREFLRSPECRDLAVVHTGSPLEVQDERVIEVGRVSTGELAALMEAAACLVMPSTYEGFGMPVLEAGVFGTPVVTTDGCPSAIVARRFGEVVVENDLTLMPAAVASCAGQMPPKRSAAERTELHASLWAEYHDQQNRAYVAAASRVD